MNVLLCRHGETPWNREGRYQGHTDIPLADSGEGQARALGGRLAEVRIHRAVASPLSRARRTAELILGQGRAAMLSFDDGLKEISHGGWEGKLVTEIAASHPELLDAWKYRPTASLPAGPNAESLQAVLERAWPALGRAVAGLGANDTVLVVAHDAVTRVLLCRVLGLPLERVWSFRQAPATLNVLSGESLEALQVVRLNDADHVAPLLQEAVHKAV
ncbi:MAG: histidine phosphatase family protein [Myxococcaceae bacterium]|nr:histidine phosphatase family protein [Myxococcaceae bacterium]